MSESYRFLRVNDDAYGIVYTFYTKKYGYTIYFNDSVYADLVADYKHLSIKSFSFGFFNADLDPAQKAVGDNNISKTIIEIVGDFFEAEGKDAVILFHCDAIDERQLMRHKTFARWYKNSDIQETIKMYTIEVDVGSTKHYMGYICHADNEHIQQLTEEFESVAQKLAPDPKATKPPRGSSEREFL